MLSTQQIIQMLSSLAAIIAFIVIATFLLKKFTRFNNKKTDALDIISSLALGTKEKLVIVQVADEQLLLGITSQSIRTLHVLKSPISPHSTVATKQEAQA